MRLNRHIADSGFCSRREADRLIAEGRVTVNGIRARIGAELGEGDEVRVDGNALAVRTAAKGQRRHVYIALNKPVGITSTTDSAVKGNIVDFVDHQQRIFPVGRLDKDSEGLILLTSNGDIVNRILRAENKLEKEYLVAVNHPVTPEFLRGMSRGVPVHGQLTLPCKTGKLGSQAEISRELAYRLYTVCERKKRAAEALSYNGLVQSWPEITRLAREGGQPGKVQPNLFDASEG